MNSNHFQSEQVRPVTSRFYETENDLQQMQGLLMEARSHTNGYAGFMQFPGYHRDLDVVTVTPDGVIAAYVNGWIDPLNRIGDFGPVGALPAYRRQGLTRATLLESLRRMQAHGMNRVCISTGVRNTAAINLYESIGFKIVNRYLDYVKKD